VREGKEQFTSSIRIRSEITEEWKTENGEWRPGETEERGEQAMGNQDVLAISR
jgi:hypothetical protein